MSADQVGRHLLADARRHRRDTCRDPGVLRRIASMAYEPRRIAARLANARTWPAAAPARHRRDSVKSSTRPFTLQRSVAFDDARSTCSKREPAGLGGRSPNARASDLAAAVSANAGSMRMASSR